MTLQPKFSRYSIWVVRSYGFGHKMEALMSSRTEILQQSSKQLIYFQSGVTEGELQEKMLLLLPHLSWYAQHLVVE